MPPADRHEHSRHRSDRTVFFFARFVLAALWIAAVSASAAIAQQNPLAKARSWGYQLQNPDPAKLASAPYDVIVIDYARDGSDASRLTAQDLASVKTKPDGSRRVVLAYLSIGEAEAYRYYWQTRWSDWWFIPNFWSAPSWRGRQNGEWGGNYAVRYWDPAWQDLIAGPGGYLERIVAAGFDGVWLDKVDSSLEDIASGRPSAKADMIAFVARIAERGRAARPGFLVVPQNGEELLPDAAYRRTIDAIGKEDLLYGEEGDKRPNTAQVTETKAGLLRLLITEGKPVLAVEYLDDRAHIDAARQRLAGFGFIPHFADRALAEMRMGDYREGTAVAAARRGRGGGGESGSRSGTDPRRVALLAGLAGLVVLWTLWRRQRR